MSPYLKTIQQMIAEDPSVAPAFAKVMAPVYREPCWVCHGLGTTAAYGKCVQCGGTGYRVLEWARP